MSLSDKAYASLRHDIIRGEFLPGQPLRLAQLQQRYGLSFSPLREALTRLATERLVVSESMRGFRIAPLSMQDLHDTMATRIFIETEALTRSIEKGGDAWETNVVACLHALGLQVKRTDARDPDGLTALEERHRAFHRALVDACASERLMQIIDGLYLGSVRYRLPGLSNHKTLPARDLAAEHNAIAHAALARDAPRATALLTEHYQQTVDALAAAHFEHLSKAI